MENIKQHQETSQKLRSETMKDSVNFYVMALRSPLTPAASRKEYARSFAQLINSIGPDNVAFRPDEAANLELVEKFGYTLGELNFVAAAPAGRRVNLLFIDYSQRPVELLLDELPEGVHIDAYPAEHIDEEGL